MRFEYFHKPKYARITRDINPCRRSMIFVDAKCRPGSAPRYQSLVGVEEPPISWQAARTEIKRTKMSILSSNTIRAAIAFGLSFGLGKGLSFLAALAMPRLLDAQTYGVVELALTIGSFGTALAGLGATSVATRMDLVDKDPRGETIIYVHCLWLALLGLGAAAGLTLAGFEPQYICGAAMVGIIGFQSSVATYTRMRGHRNLSGWFDNISMMIVFVVVLLLVLVGHGNSWTLTGGIAAAVALAGAAALVKIVQMPINGTFSALPSVVVAGVPMMLFGAGMALIFGTIRIAIAKELTLADVASYSLCARICLVLIFINQATVTGLFRSVYQSDPAAIAKKFSFWIVALSAMSVVLAGAGYYGAPLIVVGTTTPAADVAAIFPAVVTQTTIWILSSNLEIFIVRELLARPATVACLVIACVGFVIGALLWILGVLTLMVVINLYTLLMLALLLYLMRLLSHTGVDFRRAYMVLPAVLSPWLFYLLPRS